MNESEFAYRIRQALNEGAQQLDYKTSYRLEQARKKALSMQRLPAERAAWIELSSSPLQLAVGHPSGGGPDEGANSGLWRWLQRLGVITPVFVMVAGFIGVHEWQREQAITESAALDFAVLLDDFPIETYAEKGFGTLLDDGQFKL